MPPLTVSARAVPAASTSTPPFTVWASASAWMPRALMPPLTVRASMSPHAGSVISRTSVVRYRGSDRPIPEIAAELGVGSILEGSMQRAGDQVRITDYRGREYVFDVSGATPALVSPTWANVGLAVVNGAYDFFDRDTGLRYRLDAEAMDWAQ